MKNSMKGKKTNRQEKTLFNCCDKCKPHECPNMPKPIKEFVPNATIWRHMANDQRKQIEKMLVKLHGNGHFGCTITEEEISSLLTLQEKYAQDKVQEARKQCGCNKCIGFTVNNDFT